jgi:1,4-alpha-glucan branching enzyme
MYHKPQLVINDPWLEPYEEAIKGRYYRAEETKKRLLFEQETLSEFAMGHHHFGLHRDEQGWVIREWAPNATDLYLIGDCNGWKQSEEFRFVSQPGGCWELRIPSHRLAHGQLYHLLMCWPGGSGERLPAWCHRAVQDEQNKSYKAQVWFPEQSYVWQNECPDLSTEPALIYEAHVGMSLEDGRVGTFDEFRRWVLPRIVKAGYNTIQLMAIQEHPYYGSFGYHVSNLFAVSSRFGTPEQLKQLIDEAHGYGLRVIMDIVHSHAVKNEMEGISRYDGTPYQFFHDGAKGEHSAWDSRCYDYGKPEVLHFLLSNCRYWLEEYKFDGYRFDGVTSMIYYDHGLGVAFSGYGDYYNGNQDDDALVYLRLANELIHEFKPTAISIAEEMSGMPGLACSVEEGGIGFDYRLAMGTPDYWIKLIKEKSDQDWNVSGIFYELTNKRRDEKVISYAESHDQALVGDKTIIFRLIDKEMYTAMACSMPNLVVERGIALHKLIRLITVGTAGHGYLNFMGNEFGHPEWIDFPREGNGWSYHYARRQWNLRDNETLRYKGLGDFDEEMMALIRRSRSMDAPDCILLRNEDDRQLLAFRRRSLVFIFNFHPEASWTDVELDVPGSEYRIALSTDDLRFGGFGRVDTTMTYQTIARHGYHLDGRMLRVYVPSRTALVLERKA